MELVIPELCVLLFGFGGILLPLLIQLYVRLRRECRIECGLVYRLQELVAHDEHLQQFPIRIMINNILLICLRELLVVNSLIYFVDFLAV